MPTWDASEFRFAEPKAPQAVEKRRKSVKKLEGGQEQKTVSK